MSVPVPVTIVTPFGNVALGPTDPGGMVLPIPVASQIGIENGAASFTDGFPPLTMADPALGGVLPSGQDMNGLLYMTTSYCAWIQGGGGFTFNAAFVTQNTGYRVGAILRSAADPAKFFMNRVADNANDPDVDPTGWTAYSPIAAPTGVQTEALAAGPTASLALDPGVGFLEIDTTAGAAQLASITGATDGQILTVTHSAGAANFTLQNSGNIRMPSNLVLVLNSSKSLRFSSTLNLWTAM
jgi:hypothetical protein